MSACVDDLTVQATGNNSTGIALEDNATVSVHGSTLAMTGADSHAVAFCNSTGTSSASFSHSSLTSSQGCVIDNNNTQGGESDVA